MAAAAAADVTAAEMIIAQQQQQQSRLYPNVQSMFGKHTDPDKATSTALHVAQDLKTEYGSIANQRVMLKNDQFVEIILRYISDTGAVIFGGMAYRLLNMMTNQQQEQQLMQYTVDYDIYLVGAKQHAERLANTLHTAGAPRVEGSTNLHYGTYKLFVDYVPVVDIHNFPKALFPYLQSQAIRVDIKLPQGSSSSNISVLVASPDWLRLEIYKELAKPLDNPGRWAKLTPRLLYLNRTFPITTGSSSNDSSSSSSGADDNEDASSEYLESVLRLVGKFISRNGLIIVGLSSLSSFVKSHKTYAFGMIRSESYPLQVDLLDHNSSSSSNPTAAATAAATAYDVYSPNVRATVDALVTYLGRKLGGGRTAAAAAKIVKKSYGKITGILPEHVVVSIRRGGKEYKLIDVYQDYDCLGYVDATAVDAQDGSILPFRIGSVPTLLQLWFAWLFLESEELDMSSGHAGVFLGNSDGATSARKRQQQKIMAAIEYMIENQTYLASSSNSIFSHQCATSNQVTPYSAEYRELLKSYKESRHRWRWTAADAAPPNRRGNNKKSVDDKENNEERKK